MDKLPRLNRDAYKEYFYLDHKHGPRFTHFPSGDTCLMQPAHLGSASGRLDWDAKMKAFVEEHPNAHVVVTYSHIIVDDLRKHPNTGLGFAPGDDVAVINEDGELRLHTVAERLPVNPICLGDLDYELRLDDGTRLHWEFSEQAWVADKQAPWSHMTRARSPLEGEIIQRHEAATAPSM